MPKPGSEAGKWEAAKNDHFTIGESSWRTLLNTQGDAMCAFVVEDKPQHTAFVKAASNTAEFGGTSNHGTSNHGTSNHSEKSSFDGRLGSKCSCAEGHFTSKEHSHGCGEAVAATASEQACIAAWLLDWEARQERLLRQHHEHTRQLVHFVRRDLLKKHDHPKVHGLSAASAARLSHPSQPHSFLEHTASADKGQHPRFSTVGASHSEVVEHHLILTPPSEPAFSHSVTTSMSRTSRRPPPKPEWWFRGVLYAFVHSKCFNFYTSVMIALYTLAVGMMADWEMRSAVTGQEAPRWLWYLDLTFAVSFLMEVLLRVISDGSSLFVGLERNWNVFDVCVALLGLADFTPWMEMNLTIFRMLRACRALRVLRVLRQFPRLKELRLMAESICGCISSLAWAFLLLGSVQYIFAVVLLRGASESIRRGTLDPNSVQIIKSHFGSLMTTFFSLTEAVSGGRNWGDYSASFMQVTPLYGYCFPFYVIFVVFGAVNILTGIFVENTSNIARYDKELAVEEELSKADLAIEQIRDFFEQLDIDGSGTLSLTELEESLGDQRVRAYFSVLQMEVSDTHALFSLLDKDNTGDVSIDEFIQECLKLRGNAKALDLATILRESRFTRQQMKALAKSLDQRFHPAYTCGPGHFSDTLNSLPCGSMVSLPC